MTTPNKNSNPQPEVTHIPIEQSAELAEVIVVEHGALSPQPARLTTGELWDNTTTTGSGSAPQTTPFVGGNFRERYDQAGKNRQSAQADLEAVHASVNHDYTWKAIFKRMFSRHDQ